MNARGPMSDYFLASWNPGSPEGIQSIRPIAFSRYFCRTPRLRRKLSSFVKHVLGGLQLVLAC